MDKDLQNLIELKKQADQRSLEKRRQLEEDEKIRSAKAASVDRAWQEACVFIDEGAAWLSEAGPNIGLVVEKADERQLGRSIRYKFRSQNSRDVLDVVFSMEDEGEFSYKHVPRTMNPILSKMAGRKRKLDLLQSEVRKVFVDAAKVIIEACS